MKKDTVLRGLSLILFAFIMGWSFLYYDDVLGTIATVWSTIGGVITWCFDVFFSGATTGLALLTKALLLASFFVPLIIIKPRALWEKIAVIAGGVFFVIWLFVHLTVFWAGYNGLTGAITLGKSSIVVLNSLLLGLSLQSIVLLCGRVSKGKGFLAVGIFSLVLFVEVIAFISPNNIHNIQPDDKLCILASSCLVICMLSFCGFGCHQTGSDDVDRKPNIRESINMDEKKLQDNI